MQEMRREEGKEVDAQPHQDLLGKVERGGRIDAARKIILLR